MGMTNKYMESARGYIASGEFHDNRIPQHVQNQIIKLYCDIHSLKFVLSRAEYWINGSTNCQLWAALKEGFRHIVFYSIWQLPEQKEARYEIYEYCNKKKITLHFATERMKLDINKEAFGEIETLMQTNLLIQKSVNLDAHLQTLKSILINSLEPF